MFIVCHPPTLKCSFCPEKYASERKRILSCSLLSQNPGSLGPNRLVNAPNRLVNAPNWLVNTPNWLVNVPIHWDPTEHVTLGLIFLSQHYKRVISTSCTLWHNPSNLFIQVLPKRQIPVCPNAAGECLPQTFASSLKVFLIP